MNNNINVNTFWLNTKLYLLMTLFFGIFLSIIAVLTFALGVTNFVFYIAITVGIILIQYLVGPYLVEMSMGVKYVSEKEYPKLHKMVEELAKEAKIPKPRVAVCQNSIPNAFAFGRWSSDGRVCVTSGILDLLNEKELRAVIGHEIGHLKNRDVAIITLLSVVPTIAWYLGRSFLYSSNSNNKNGGSAIAVGLFAFLIYFVTNMLVLYASRIREYYADLTSVKLGNNPEYMASALYKLVYGAAKANSNEIHKVEGMKAFFANDISSAKKEFSDLSKLDADGSGHIDENELLSIKDGKAKVSFADSMMEFMSTHPNMVKRISALSKLK